MPPSSLALAAGAKTKDEYDLCRFVIKIIEQSEAAEHTGISHNKRHKQTS